MEVAMPPLQVAGKVFDAIRNEQFYILTHPEWMDVIRMRTDDLLRLENPQDPTPAILKILTPAK